MQSVYKNTTTPIHPRPNCLRWTAEQQGELLFVSWGSFNLSRIRGYLFHVFCKCFFLCFEIISGNHLCGVSYRMINSWCIRTDIFTAWNRTRPGSTALRPEKLLDNQKDLKCLQTVAQRANNRICRAPSDSATMRNEPNELCSMVPNFHTEDIIGCWRNIQQMRIQKTQKMSAGMFYLRRICRQSQDSDVPWLNRNLKNHPQRYTGEWCLKQD